ncbi:RagB/SusD family nutrient uptake outer membrane protein [Paraflavisolibacter sp. H34]|uniref:RagB/SusD family nutrient uptake outer membrane protein n=1 Tax=Huijunlia imazamoxiresistens TaxID=3127457 RepID=UPI00301612FD
MKKTTFKYLPLLAAALAFVQAGCNKITDMKPIQEISDADYWKTADQFRLAANEFLTFERSFTDVLQDGPHSELRSDLLTGSSKNVFSSGVNAITASDGNWKTGFSRIRSVNYLLEKAATYARPAEIAQYVAEAKFFRAYVYFDLLQQFGGVPILTKPLNTTSPELSLSRSGRDAVVDFIIQDLEAAIPVLALESALPAAQKGRVSKGAAQSFLARVALYEGTWQKARSGAAARYNGLLDKAIAASDSVIASNQYALYAPAALGDSAQKYLFILEDAKSNPAGLNKSTNKEYILANRYDQASRQVRFNITQTVTNNAAVNWPTRKLADMYLMQNGLPIDHPKSGFGNPDSAHKGYATTRSEYEKRDNRMRYTLMIDSNYYWDNKAVSSRVSWAGDAADIAHSRGRHNAASGTGYANQKWAAERLVADQEESYDYPVIRFSEVLLTYAEARFERDGAISDADLDKSLNKVRQRVNKNMPKLTNAFVAANGLDLRKELRRERTVELYYEGFRLDDLKRWKTAEVEMPMDLQGITWKGSRWETRWTAISNQVKNNIYTLEQGRKWEQKHYLLPIPTQQITLMGWEPSKDQNPGW